MNRRTYLIPTFIICFLLSLTIFFFMRSRSFDLPDLLISPLQKKIFITQNSNFSSMDKLKQENMQLRIQLAQMNLVLKDNQALKDQFNLNSQFNPPGYSSQLLPAAIVSMPEFLPGLNKPLACILDKGSKAQAYIGQPVVIKNILVGTVVKTTNNFSQVRFTLFRLRQLSQ